MHELGIAQELLRAILPEAERHGATAVTGVTLCVGVLRAVVPENLSFLFGHVAQGTIAEGATLRFEDDPLVVECPACGARTEAQELTTACPACGAPGVRLSGGDRMDIVSIDLEAGSGGDGN